jgi:hypothetical protein
MIQVYENFLDNDTFTKMQEIFLGDRFPWYWNDSVVSKEFDYGKFQFTHNLWDKLGPTSDNYFPHVTPLIDAINPLALVRVKVNLLTQQADQELNWWHIDLPNMNTAIFYLNDGDGYTVFETGEKVYSKANTLVAFDSNIYHTGCSNSDTRRVLININWIQKPEDKDWKLPYPPK